MYPQVKCIHSQDFDQRDLSLSHGLYHCPLIDMRHVIICCNKIPKLASNMLF